MLTPDGPNTIEHLLPLVSRIENRAHVVAFDMPGFGLSAPSRHQTHGLRVGGEFILELMNALEVPRALLAFSCANGFYARVAAELAPDRIAGLVLSQTPTLAAMRAWAKVNIPRALRVPLVGQALARWQRRRLAAVWYSRALPPEADRGALRTQALATLEAGGCFCLAGVAQGLLREPDDALQALDLPTRMLWGDADPSHAASNPTDALAGFSGATLERLPGVGHFPDIESPDAWQSAVEAILHA